MMRNILLALMLCVCACADGALTYTKREMIDLANYHTKNGNGCMRDLESVYSYLPDLGSKEHMDALIQSAVLSTTVQNPRAKILAVGLRIIASLAVESHTNYLKARTKLYTASYHYEMANYYNAFSLHVPGYKWMDAGTKHFFNAIDNLTVCVMLSQCVGDKWCRDIVMGYFVDHRDDLLKQFMYAGKKSTAGIYDDALCFYENVSEIACEIEDEIIRQELCTHTGASVESIACALRNLEDFECWPDLDEWKRIMGCF